MRGALVAVGVVLSLLLAAHAAAFLWLAARLDRLDRRFRPPPSAPSVRL